MANFGPMSTSVSRPEASAVVVPSVPAQDEAVVAESQDAFCDSKANGPARAPDSETPAPQLPVTDSLATDSLAAGLSFMLVASLLQRGVGFARNVAFCSFLPDDQLGMWALASSFFILAAPLSVLGLPGCFGRFVEYYRARQQLGLFLRRTALGSLLGTTLALAALALAPEFLGTLIFGEFMAFSTMVVVSIALLSVIVFNFLTELLSGLRQPKTVSQMHAVNSLGFAVFGVSWLMVGGGFTGLVGAFSVAAALGCLPGCYTLLTRCRTSLSDRISEPLAGFRAASSQSMWQKIMPFAAAMWIMNLLSNLFDVVDRYMLLHMVSDQAEVGQAYVGQYHCGRILPLLLTSLAMMVSGMLLPYLSADWERRRTESVRRTLELGIKLTAFAFTALALVAIATAPYVFQLLTQNRYADGLAIMPLAMVHCTWAALAMLLQSYLWCAERGRLIGAIVAAGLIMNIGLNWWLVPLWDLQGAIVATTMSGAVILLMTYRSVRRLGCKLSLAVAGCCVVPLCLLLPIWAVPLAFGLLVATAIRTDWFFSDREQQLLFALVEPIFRRLSKQLGLIR
jgi:O-antigen/teichoic acid export membrane protein